MTKFQKLLFLIIFFIISNSLNFSPPATILNFRVLDLFRTAHAPHPEIIILAIDNKSLSEIGRWPWKRSTHAKIIEKVSDIKPQALGVDITFSETENQFEDKILADTFKKADYPIILASEPVFVKGQKDSTKTISPLPIFLENKFVSTGQTNIQTDADGINRISPSSLSFSFQLAKVLNANLPRDPFLIDYVGPAGTFSTYSIIDFLSGKVPAEKLSGKIILIGASASDLHDTVLIPPGKVIAGVEWNANVLDNLLLKRFITLIPKIVPFLLSFLVGILYILFFSKLSPRRMSIILACLILIFPALSFILWQQKLALFYLSNSLLAFLLLIFNGGLRWITTEIEKRKLKNTFQPYFSPAVMDAILKDPSLLNLGGRSMEVTILFSDIRNFTTITESLPPETLTHLLQEYFTEVSEEILKTNGVIDKFIGDAVMAFWGAPITQPGHADSAVSAAVNMVKKIKRLQIKWQKMGLPFIDMGVGINTGVVTVGNMGSRQRFDYTLIGDGVNLASRLEGLNKEYKSHIIISEATKVKLTIPVKLKSLGQVTVKGKTKNVKIYMVYSN